jgi:hypothetical protein
MNLHSITIHLTNGEADTRYYATASEADNYVKGHLVLAEMFPGQITGITRGCVVVSVSEFYKALGIDPADRDVRVSV